MGFGDCFGFGVSRRGRTSSKYNVPTQPRSVEDAVFSYAPLPDSGPYGKGLLVMVTLFTSDLRGYNTDRNLIYNFFTKDLGYRCMERRNINKRTMFEFIDKVRQTIEDEPFDRMVFVILSHGLEGGIMTCADGSGINAEKGRNGYEVLTAVDEIVSCFKHDKVKRLKNCPKLFLIQACRGTDIVQTASHPLYPSGINLQPTVPIDADILILYASTERNFSFVHDDNGSWLIECAIRIFKKHYKTMHAEDMMTVMLNVVAEVRANGPKNAIFVQIPVKVSTFRRQFWLYHKDIDTQMSVIGR